MRHTVLISDMHLCAQTPDLNQLFFQKLSEWAGNIDALYLLGDIFDVWVGDDDDDPVLAQIVSAMSSFASQTDLFVMRGNRDFLIGRKFAKASGATMLNKDPCLVKIYNTPYILSHGDIMCGDDVKYQQFRKTSRRWWWQRLALSKPLSQRRALAAQIRNLSESQKSDTTHYAIADVTERDILSVQKKFSGRLLKPADMIHGHTHKPARHLHQFNGKTFRRFVLPDWKDGHGGCLNIFEDGTIAGEIF